MKLFQFYSSNPEFKSLQGYDMIIAFSQEIIAQTLRQIFTNYPHNYFLKNESVDGVCASGGDLIWHYNKCQLSYTFSAPYININKENKVTLITSFTVDRYLQETVPKTTPTSYFITPQILNLQVKLQQDKLQQDKSILRVYEDVEKTIEASPSADQQFLQWYSKTSPFPIAFPIILKTSIDNETPDFMPTNADYAFFCDSISSNQSSLNYLVVVDNKALPGSKEGVPYRNWIDRDDIQGVFVLSANLIMNWFLKIFAKIFNSSLNDFKQEIAGGSVTAIFNKENFGFDIEKYISLPEIQCVISVLEDKLCTACFLIPNDESIDFIFGFNPALDTNNVYLTFTSPEVAKYKAFQTKLEEVIHKLVSKPDMNSVGKVILASEPIAINTLTTANIVLPEGDDFFFKDARFVDRNLVVSVTYRN